MACSPPTPTFRSAIERARDRLRELDVDFDPPAAARLAARLDAVLAVVYLLFSQGCHATHADVPIRRDLCDEARRLARMLAAHPAGDVPAVHALLALMCFHAARFDARVALDGAIVLLEEQDRSAWNWNDVREGMASLARSAAGDELTRYHVEAGIAWEHCRAATFADTDWRRIAELYDTLDRIAPSPLHALNRAVAEAYLNGPQAALDRLAAVPRENVPTRYPGWHAVVGELHFRLGQHAAAALAWRGSPAPDHRPRRSGVPAPPPRRMRIHVMTPKRFGFSAFKDRYHEKVSKLIQSKAAGKETA